jgi:putative acetyltransferase
MYGVAITIIQVSPSNNDLINLIEKLDQYLLERYPPDEVFVIDFSDPDIAATIFMIAYEDSQPLGCGAIRPIESDVIELKRFFVDPAYRKQGIAGNILAQLEKKARDLNYSTIRLEAGEQQLEALHFYKKHGYYEIERYGEHVNCGSSLCFEKQLRKI